MKPKLLAVSNANSQVYGRRKMKAALRREHGINLDRERVGRLMRSLYRWGVRVAVNSAGSGLDGGYSLVVHVVDLSVIVANDLVSGASKGDMLRAVRQFVMDADRASDVSALIDARPESTGDVRWDALISGVVEDVAVRHGVPIPAWVVAHEPLEEWWFVSDFAGLHATALVETPPAVARHGVFIRRASLVNV